MPTFQPKATASLLSPTPWRVCRHRAMGAGRREGLLSQGQGTLPSCSVAIKFSERSRNWRYGRSRRFSTCWIRFPARDRKL